MKKIIILIYLIFSVQMLSADSVSTDPESDFQKEPSFETEFVEDENFEMEADNTDLDAFGDEEFEGEIAFETKRGEETKPSWLESLFSRARFTVSHELSYKTEDPEQVQNNRTGLRLEFNQFFARYFYLQLDTKLNLYWSNDHRAEAEEEETWVDNNTREGFLQASIGNTSVKAGYQILVWGESDGGAITDVISPRNYSELFFISLEESRIGQALVSVEQFTSWGDFSLFYIPDPELNDYPEEGTAYYYDPFDGQVVYQEEENDQAIDEFGFRWKKTIGRSDISLMAASLIENDYALELGGTTNSGQWIINKKKERFTMVGFAFNLVQGNFLYKGEWARKTPQSFNNSSLDLEKKNVTDTALGIEYSPGSYMLSFEATNRHIDEWHKELAGVEEDSYSLVVAWNKTFLNEDLTVDWITSYTNPSISFLHMLELNYKWNDTFSTGLKGVYPDIVDEDSEYWIYRDQKQVVFNLKMQF